MPVSEPEVKPAPEIPVVDSETTPETPEPETDEEDDKMPLPKYF